MEKVELAITDVRMLDLMDYCIENEVQDVRNKVDFLNLIGFNPSNIHGVQIGMRGFSKEQLRRAGEVFGVSMDYLFGFSNEIFRGKKQLSALEQLETAVRVVKMELRDRKGSKKKSNNSKK